MCATVAGLFIATVSSSRADAAVGDRTMGAAQAVLQAGANGGLVVLTNGHGHGDPAGIIQSGDPEDVKIFALGPNDAYCASGWHVIDLNDFDAVDLYPSKQAMFDSLNAVQESFELDSVALATQRTAIKKSPANLGPTGLNDVYWFGVGALMRPGSLTVGTHALRTIILDPTYGNLDVTVQFSVLPC